VTKEQKIKNGSSSRVEKARAFARHARTNAQSKARGFWSLAFKGLAVIVGASLAITGISLWKITDEIKSNNIVLVGVDGNALPPVTAADLKGPINMLLVGSDTRAGQGGGFGSVSSVLADVIILLHVSADRKNAVALSFPRDLLVPWPACPSTSGGSGYLPQSKGQINATIANGGPGCTLLTVEALTGVKIPYLAMIDFKGVIEMSNAIGGVDVCVANAISDEYTKTYLSAGNHTLQGREALQFLRTRHGVGDGSDLSRISNQQVFLTSLVRKVKSQGVLSNPLRLYSLARAASSNMKLSDSLSNVGVLVGIASALKSVDLQNITFLQLPSRAGLPAPDAGRVKPIYEQANILFEKLVNDKPIILNKADKPRDVKATTKPKPSASAASSSAPAASGSASPSAKPTVTALPPGFRGTDGATTTCSNN
jgi:LCP family protein required for cell wall assembly